MPASWSLKPDLIRNTRVVCSGATQNSPGADGNPPDLFGVLWTFDCLLVAAGMTGHDVQTQARGEEVKPRSKNTTEK